MLALSHPSLAGRIAPCPCRTCQLAQAAAVSALAVPLCETFFRYVGGGAYRRRHELASRTARRSPPSTPTRRRVFDEYVELVKRVEQTYYLSVKRYTSGAFLRHKLGTELAKREISSEVLHPRANNRR
jgi:hypothetical protein